MRDCDYCYIHLIRPNKLPTDPLPQCMHLGTSYLSCLPMDIVEILLQYFLPGDSLRLTDTFSELNCLQSRLSYWKFLYGQTFTKKVPKTKNLQQLYRTHKSRLANTRNKLLYMLTCDLESCCETYIDQHIGLDNEISLDMATYFFDAFNLGKNGSLDYALAIYR